MPPNRNVADLELEFVAERLRQNRAGAGQLSEHVPLADELRQCGVGFSAVLAARLRTDPVERDDDLFEITEHAEHGVSVVVQLDLAHRLWEKRITVDRSAAFG